MDLLLHLRTFCAVVDERSFTRAAAQLGQPQPVVSRRVAALERHLGGRLLVRDPRGVQPNDLGRTVLPHARDLLTRADHLMETVREVGHGVTLWLPEGVGARDLVTVRATARELGLELTFETGGPRARLDMTSRSAPVLALVSCSPEESELAGPVGAGSRVESPDVLPDETPRLHLDTLRVRRGEDARPRVLHVGVEDDQPGVRDVVHRHAVRVGLTPAQVLVGSTALTAVGDVLVHQDVWLCTEREARSHGLRWRPIAGLPLARHYRLAGSRAGTATMTGGQRDRLVAAVGAGLGLRASRGAR